MPSELIINTAPWETRIALLENGSVVEFHFEALLNKGCCEEETISRGEEKGWRGSV
jgi:hypothetical protein